MKKLKLLALGLISLLAVNVSAAEVDTTDKLVDCMTNASDEVCTLTADVELSASLEVGKEVVLDLNGQKITPAATFAGDSLIIVLHGGELTVEDSKGNGEINTGINEDVFVGIKMTKAGCDTTNKAALIVNSGTIKGYDYGISGNGNPDRINTSIVINGGTVAAINEKGTGIFHPQVGALEVNGGTITGGTGIEMRSGDLIVKGGTITGTYKPSSSTGNLNGTTTLGAGIAVAQHSTKKDISVSVAGGTIEGYTAFYQSNPQLNDQEALDKVKLEITGGTFEVINEGTEAIHSEDYEAFITGGSFSTDIAEKDIAKDLEEIIQNGVHYVGTKNKITVEKTGEGEAKVDLEEAIEGQTITITATPAEGYKLKTIEVATADETIEVIDNKFTMPNEKVKVTVTFEKEEVIADNNKEEVEKEEDNTAEKDKLEEEKDTTVSGEGEKEKNPDTNDMISTVLVFFGISLIGVILSLYINKKYN